MARIVNCLKLGRQAEGLAKAPYPGETGEKIYHNISKDAWQMWLGEQTKLINEYRLSIIDPKAREFLRDKMMEFLFDEEQGITTG